VNVGVRSGQFGRATVVPGFGRLQFLSRELYGVISYTELDPVHGTGATVSCHPLTLIHPIQFPAIHTYFLGLVALGSPSGD
jgi:hypothetical protein